MQRKKQPRGEEPAGRFFDHEKGVENYEYELPAEGELTLEEG